MLKVGDKIRRISSPMSWAPIGFESIVVKSHMKIGYTDNEGSFVALVPSQWELIEEKKGPEGKFLVQGMSQVAALGKTWAGPHSSLQAARDAIEAYEKERVKYKRSPVSLQIVQVVEEYAVELVKKFP